MNNKIKINRLFFIKIHIVIASFILPILLLFFITGSSYIIDIIPSGKKNVIILNDKNLKSLSSLDMKNYLLSALAENKIIIDEKKISYKSFKNTFYAKASNVNIKIEILGDKKVGNIKIIIKDNDYLQKLFELHKNKGSIVFKIYTLFFVLSMLIVFLSGIYLGWKVKNLRKYITISFSLSLTVFILELFLNL